jgi:endonuclease G
MRITILSSLVAIIFSLNASATDFTHLLEEGAKKAIELAEHRNSGNNGASQSTYAPDLYSKAQLSQSFGACLDQFPNHDTSKVTSAFSQSMNPTALCSDGFAVWYSKKAKAPLVVVEKLNAARINDAKGEQRTDEFYPDPRLKQGERAELDDFKGSGYDRGHNSPAADATNPHQMAQTFALSNMFMQNQTNNRKLWSKIEGDTRKYAFRASGDVFVFTGPLFLDNQLKTMGENRVWVPSHLFKLVYDATTRKSWAFVYENNDHPSHLAPISYEQFVAVSGLKLLP